MCHLYLHWNCCSHITDISVECFWQEEKYCYTLRPDKEGFCRSCRQEKLAESLMDYCPDASRAALNMLNAIKEANSAEVDEVTTPEAAATYLRKSRERQKARSALQQSMGLDITDWLDKWLYDKFVPDSSGSLKTSRAKENDVKTCLINPRKTPQSRNRSSLEMRSFAEKLEVRSLANDPFTERTLPAPPPGASIPKRKFDGGLDYEMTAALNSSRQWKGAQPDWLDGCQNASLQLSTAKPMSALVHNQRRLQKPMRHSISGLNLSGISNFEFDDKQRARWFGLPEIDQRPVQQLRARTSISAPTLPSQQDTARYPTPQQTPLPLIKSLKWTKPVVNKLPGINTPDLEPKKIPGIDIPFSAHTTQTVWNQLPVVRQVPEPQPELQIQQYVPKPLSRKRELSALERFHWPFEIRRSERRLQSQLRARTVADRDK